jgi:hypothetical protein
VLLQIKDELRGLRERLDDHCSNHPLEHHDHLIDRAEHESLHGPKERRTGEQRKGERRTSTETYDGEERRA